MDLQRTRKQNTLRIEMLIHKDNQSMKYSKDKAEYTNLMWGNNETMTEKKGGYTRTSRPKKGRKQTTRTYRYSEANLR